MKYLPPFTYDTRFSSSNCLSRYYWAVLILSQRRELADVKIYSPTFKVIALQSVSTKLILYANIVSSNRKNYKFHSFLQHEVFFFSIYWFGLI